MALAEKFGITQYPTPAGGCALTQEGFANRLKELMKNKPKFAPEDLDLIVIGRHFFKDNSQIILGRNEQENEILASAAKKGDILIEPESFVGPTALVKEKIDNTIIEKAKNLIIKFSPKAKNVDVTELTFKFSGGDY